MRENSLNEISEGKKIAKKELIYGRTFNDVVTDAQPEYFLTTGIETQLQLFTRVQLL